MKLFDFLKNESGDFSSKRLFGITCLIQAVVLSYTGGTVEIVGVWLGAASVVLVGQALTKT